VRRQAGRKCWLKATTFAALINLVKVLTNYESRSGVFGVKVFFRYQDIIIIKVPTLFHTRTKQNLRNVNFL
jgi:hypothetical protein